MASAISTDEIYIENNNSDECDNKSDYIINGSCGSFRSSRRTAVGTKKLQMGQYKRSKLKVSQKQRMLLKNILDDKEKKSVDPISSASTKDAEC